MGRKFHKKIYRFQLTRLMRGVTKVLELMENIIEISTHTPHARRDGDVILYDGKRRDFNSHASCEA